MAIEVATFINDLQPVNPPSTDPRGQGDDHLRLIKQVLQNQFTGASRVFQIPTTLAKTANYSVVKADGESTIYCGTGAGAVTFTLPTLLSGDQGWKVHFIKTTTDVNPMFIAPPSGNLNSGGLSVTKARRCIPGIRVTAIWDGTAFFVTRSLALPISSYVAYNSAALPAGYEWPNGQVLSSSANYPEYFAWTGSGQTADVRGRTFIPLDNLGGSAAGRLPSGLISGSTLNAVGGVDSVTLSVAQIATGLIGNNSGNFGISVVASGNIPVSTGVAIADTGYGSGPIHAPATVSNAGVFSNQSPTISGTVGSGTIAVQITNAGGQSHSNLQPSIMVGMLLVVE